MSISYNFLNLPSQLGSLGILYDATGRKWRKAGQSTTTLYSNGIEYRDGKLEAIYLPDGRLAAEYAGSSIARYRAEYFHQDHLGNTRLAFSDFNQDQSISLHDDPATPESELEITQEAHYYPFGMGHLGPWYESVNPENKHLYNGKELNDEEGVGLYDYGARWYDAAYGRFVGVDPLAADFVAWSSYSYTFNNPIRFIDPDGRSPDDIIIGNKDLDKRWEAFSSLQKLTNDLLTMDSNGKVTISKAGAANQNKTLTEGTKLVSGLINDNNTTTIKLDMGRVNSTFAVNESTNTEIRALPQENLEYGANVYIKGTDPTTANADGSRGIEGGAFITLGHELNHARDLVTGNFDRTVLPPVIDFDPIPAKVTDKFTRREFNTRVFENKLRDEHGFKARALPLSLSAFQSIRF